MRSAKTLHRERGFETHTYSRQLIAKLVCIFKSPLPVEGLSKFLSLWRVSDCLAGMYVRV